MGPFAAILIFLLIPVATALFLFGYLLVVLAFKVPPGVWALAVSMVAAILVLRRRNGYRGERRRRGSSRCG